MAWLLAVAWTSPAKASWPTSPTVNLPVCTATGVQTSPEIVGDGSGGAIIAWSDHRGASTDVYAQHVLASGATDPAWPADGLALCTAVSNQVEAVIASDNAGGAIVAWSDYRAGSTSDIYAQHALGTGTVDPAWPADGRALCVATGNQLSPVIAADGAGGAIVAWSDERGGATSDIYAARVLSSGAADPAWPADGRAVCTATGDQLRATIVAGLSGSVLLAWQDFRGGTSADIYAERVLVTGATDPAWPANGRALCGATGDQNEPAIAGDGAGGAIVAWQDFRAGTTADIYAQHVSAAGAVDPAWPADGRALCTATGGQQYPSIVSDDAGGAIVAWQDMRGGATSDIYAARVLAGGTLDPAWPANGRALCTAAGNQQAVTLVPDGTGGAIATWRDMRAGSTNYDVYAQRVMSSSFVDPGWPVDGCAVCTAVDFQDLAAPVADGARGVVVAWADRRSGTYDIYAQHVAPGGYLGSSAPTAAWDATPATVAFAPPSPNPAIASATLRFTLPRETAVSITVYDAVGRHVRSLATGSRPAGAYAVRWDLADDVGHAIPTGLYFVRFEAEGLGLTRRLAVTR